jgi:hypothetical protein
MSIWTDSSSTALSHREANRWAVFECLQVGADCFAVDGFAVVEQETWSHGDGP